MKLTEPQIEAAAEWWANALGGSLDILGTDVEPQPEEKVTQDMFALLTTMLRAKNPITAYQKGLFKTALKTILETAVPTNIGVDYHPDRILSLAAHIAGIDESHFPPKSRMMFYDSGEVKAYSGYGKSYETILEGSNV